MMSFLKESVAAAGAPPQPSIEPVERGAGAPAIAPQWSVSQGNQGLDIGFLKSLILSSRPVHFCWTHDTCTGGGMQPVHPADGGALELWAHTSYPASRLATLLLSATPTTKASLRQPSNATQQSASVVQATLPLA